MHISFLKYPCFTVGLMKSEDTPDLLNVFCCSTQFLYLFLASENLAHWDKDVQFSAMSDRRHEHDIFDLIISPAIHHYTAFHREIICCIDHVWPNYLNGPGFTFQWLDRDSIIFLMTHPCVKHKISRLAIEIYLMIPVFICFSFCGK